MVGADGSVGGVATGGAFACAVAKGSATTIRPSQDVVVAWAVGVAVSAVDVCVLEDQGDGAVGGG